MADVNNIIIQNFNETINEKYEEKSDIYKLIIGIICGIIGSISLGSSLVPIRKYFSKDGQIIQFLISISLVFFGAVIQGIQGFPHIHYSDFIGGFFLSLVLVLLIPIINNIGSCLLFIVWNSVIIISFWFFSFFNLYGEIAFSTDMPFAQYIGIILFILPIIGVFFVKTVPNEFYHNNKDDIPLGVENFTMESSTTFSYDLKQYNDFQNMHSLTSSKRIISIGAAISTGICLSVTFYPYNFDTQSLIHMPNTIFSHALGTFILSFIFFIIYTIYQKGALTIDTRLILPSFFSVNCCIFILLHLTPIKSILFPQKNQIRSYDLLDGLWTFVREPKNSIGYGFINNWYKLKLKSFTNSSVMPVPSAYNDINEDKNLRDHVGWVWYQKEYIVTNDDCNKRFFLRFGSVNYNAVVFLNNEHIMSHTGGHLPFENEVFFICNNVNIITVAVNNTLSHDTIPPGEFQYKLGNSYPKGFFTTTPGFDFFNYAGILRSVYVVKLNKYFIQSLTINTNTNGLLKYKIKIDKGMINKKKYNKSIDIEKEIKFPYIYDIKIIDEDDNIIQNYIGNDYGDIKINQPKLWWPRGYGNATLYKFVIDILSKDKKIIYDKYIETFGFRSIDLTNDSILINGKPFYCIGFGMHEDSDIRGRGFDRVIMTRDLNLFEWMNGNCYRTSHYPYSEERAYEADRRGIVVITETPAVGLKYFGKSNLIKLHQKMIKEMITRDRNHPSIIAWSLANEPWSTTNDSGSYFYQMYKTAKEIDPTRPITTVYGPTGYGNDKSAKYMDFICINRYYGWYNNIGYLEIINSSLVHDIINWKKKYNVPLIITEYGADSISGLESLPSVDFTTNYQNDLIIETHKALDNLRLSKTLTGEMIWNFADFMTAPSITRAYGNHKGVFTRQRQPKLAAFTLRDRYKKLSKI